MRLRIDVDPGRRRFLVLILALLAVASLMLIKRHNVAADQYGSVVVGLMLLFNHLACFYTRTGWKRSAMKGVAWTWIVLGSAYVVWTPL